MESATNRFVAAVSAAKNAGRVWSALHDLARDTVGARLFTVTTVEMEAGLARRVYTSHPADYPVSGTKPIHRDAWFAIVHDEGRSFVANTIEDIAAVFPDHALIASLGCSSVLNLPIVLKGELVATVNLLDVPGHFTPERAADAEALLALPARLCWSLAALFDSKANPSD